MTDSINHPTEPTRVKAFARFFKNYMSIWTLVIAALPIPATAFKLIPTYSALRGYLSVYTSLFCFLLLGFIFYSRIGLGKVLFSRGTRLSIRNIARWIVAFGPFLLICVSFFSTLQYHSILQDSLIATGDEIAERSLFWERVEDELRDLPDEINTSALDSLVTMASGYGASGYGSGLSDEEILQLADSRDIRAQLSWFPFEDAALLTFYYVLIFISAEAAFIIMALKEYLQDLVGLDDLQLLSRTEPGREEPVL